MGHSVEFTRTHFPSKLHQFQIYSLSVVAWRQTHWWTVLKAVLCFATSWAYEVVSLDCYILFEYIYCNDACFQHNHIQFQLSVHCLGLIFGPLVLCLLRVHCLHTCWLHLFHRHVSAVNGTKELNCGQPNNGDSDQLRYDSQSVHNVFWQVWLTLNFNRCTERTVRKRTWRTCYRDQSLNECRWSLNGWKFGHWTVGCSSPWRGSVTSRRGPRWRRLLPLTRYRRRRHRRCPLLRLC